MSGVGLKVQGRRLPGGALGVTRGGPLTPHSLSMFCLQGFACKSRVNREYISGPPGPRHPLLPWPGSPLQER